MAFALFPGMGICLPGRTVLWCVRYFLGVLFDPSKPGGSAILGRAAPWYLHCFPVDVVALATVLLEPVELALQERGSRWERGPVVEVGYAGG